MNFSLLNEKFLRLSSQGIYLRIMNSLRIYDRLRILKYKILSDCKTVIGKPKLIGATLLKGNGKITFGRIVTLGVKNSPYFYSTYCYIEARNAFSSIEIGSNVFINNNVCIVCEGEGIQIGENTLIGTNVFITDSDFHSLNPSLRLSGVSITSRIEIGNNVFIGSNVTILKGVLIGENSVIGSGSVVTRSIPPNVIAGGIPCKVIKTLNFTNINN